MEQPDIQTVDKDPPSSSSVEQGDDTLVQSRGPADHTEGKRLFALFQPGHRVSSQIISFSPSKVSLQTPLCLLSGDQDASSASSSVSSSSGKRAERYRSARDKRPCYTAPWLVDGSTDQAEEDDLMVGSACPSNKRNTPPDSSSSKGTAKKKNKQQQQTTPSVTEIAEKSVPKPLPPLSLKVQGNSDSDAPVHSFFAKRAKQTTQPDAPSNRTRNEPSVVTQPREKRKKAVQAPPVWPDRDSVHVRPIEEPSEWISSASLSRVPTLPVKSDKGKARAADLHPSERVLHLPQHGLAKRVREAISRGRPLSWQSNTSLLGDTQHHPSSKEGGRDPDNHRLSVAWTDRHRPRKASDILGNTECAIYLRDWLLELQLTSGEGPPGSTVLATEKANKVTRRRVQTTVDKNARKAAARRARINRANGFGPGTDEGEDSLYDFIIPDDEYEESAATPGTEGSPRCAETDVGESLTSDEPGATHSNVIRSQAFAASSVLTNSIILCGPPGTGKTAAVYACADELGYEVFELFAGMGKRGSKELNQAVGDLARNHMVSGGGSGGGARRTAQGDKTGNAFSAMMKPALDSLLTNGHEHRDGFSGGARQSLILLEEVDIVFEEDKSFWTGVTDLIARSRRPVVMTCNDLSYIPLNTLPVQEVLTFHLLPKEVVWPHLSRIVSAEGISGSALDSKAAARVGESSHPDNAEADEIDLRQAIHQLQFMCAQRDSLGQLARGDDSDAQVNSSHSPHAAALAIDDKSQQPSGEFEEATASLATLRKLTKALEAQSMAITDLARPFVRQSAGDVPFVPALPLQQTTPASASSTSSHGTTPGVNATGSSGGLEDILAPVDVRLLRQQPAAHASPVVLPLQGREEEIQQAVETLARRICLGEYPASGKIAGRASDAELLRTPERFAEEQRRQRFLLYEALASLHPLFSDLYQRCGMQAGVSIQHPHVDPDAAKDTTNVPALLGGQVLSSQLAPAVRLMVRIDDFDEAAWHFEVAKRKAELQQATQAAAAAAAQQACENGDDPQSAVAEALAPSRRNTRNSNRFSLLVESAANSSGGRSEIFDRQLPLGAGGEGLAAARKSGAAFVSAWLRIPPLQPNVPYVHHIHLDHSS